MIFFSQIALFNFQSTGQLGADRRNRVCTARADVGSTADDMQLILLTDIDETQ